MGTPSGLNVVLGYAKADLNAFTPQELMFTVNYLVRDLRPIIGSIVPSKKISQHLAKIRSDWRLTGGPALQNPLVQEYALSLGSSEVGFGPRIAESIQRHERTSMTELFLTKKERVLLFKMSYASRVTGPSKWVNRIESESIVDLTSASEHPDLTSALVHNCIHLTSLTLYQFCEERRKQLDEARRIHVRIERMAASSELSRQD